MEQNNDNSTNTNQNNDQPVSSALPGGVTQPSNATAAPQPSQPAVSPTTTTSSSDGNSKSKKSLALPLVGLAALALGLLGGFFLTTAFGNPLNKQEQKVATVEQTKEKKELELPEGAVEINACAKGRGKQFALPNDIPFGPVYNVHEGKITAIEFMPAQADFSSATPKDFIDLKLYGVEYDHVNIGLLSKGHAGYPAPHYHIDVFTITHEESTKITCE